jgi:hypothetical protein
VEQKPDLDWSEWSANDSVDPEVAVPESPVADVLAQRGSEFLVQMRGRS